MAPQPATDHVKFELSVFCADEIGEQNNYAKVRTKPNNRMHGVSDACKHHAGSAVA